MVAPPYLGPWQVLRYNAGNRHYFARNVGKLLYSANRGIKHYGTNTMPPTPKSSQKRVGTPVKSTGRLAKKMKTKAVKAGHKRKSKKTKGTRKKSKRSKSSVSKAVKNVTPELHSGMGTASLRCVVKSKCPKKTVGRWIYSQSTAGKWDSNAGCQSNGCFMFFNTQNQLITDTVAAYDLETNYYGLINMNPFLKTTGTTAFPAVATPATNKFLLRKITVELDVTNWTNYGFEGVLQLWLCKKDQSNDACEAANAILLNQGLGVIISSPNLPGVITGMKSAAKLDFASVTMKDAHGLPKFWKNIGSKSIVLAGAASDKIHITILMNTVIDQVVCLGALGPYIKGYTICASLIGRGQVVSDHTGGTNNYPTYGATHVAWVAQTKYFMHAVKDSVASLDDQILAYNLPTGTTGPNTLVMNYTDAAPAAPVRLG